MQCIIKSWNSFPQDVEEARNTKKFKDERSKIMLNRSIKWLSATCSGNHSIAKFQKGDSYCPGSCQDRVNSFGYPGDGMARILRLFYKIHVFARGRRGRDSLLRRRSSGLAEQRWQREPAGIVCCQ